MSSSCSSTDLGIDADFEEILTDSLINDIEVFAEHINRLRQALDPNSYVPDGETKCVQVHAALSMVSQSVRDLLVRHPIFKTSLVLIPASQLVHSVKAISFDNANVDSAKTLQCIEKLEAAVGNTLRQCMHGHSNSQSPTSKRTTATLGRKLDKQTSVYVSAAASASTSNSEGQQNGLRSRLARRHSTFQPKTTTNAADSEARLMHELLSCHEDGMELAFSRCKAWSKYVGHLLTFVRNRLSLEHEHAKSVQKLAEQTKTLLTADANNNCLPLVGIFNELMDYSSHFSTRAEQVISALNLRFVQTLEGRQKDHDNKRRKLKAEWTKQRKQYDACVEELRRARQNLNSKEDGYLKARDSTLRHEQSVPAGILTTEITRKRKEVEKRRKNEEDALNRKTDAEHEVWRLELELDGRSRGLDELRLHIVNDLCDLIRHQHITTTACASHYFKAFADLWAPVPEEYDRLAHAIRENSPGTEYMSFLQNLPGRSVSSASLFRGYNKAEDDSMPYSAATGMSDSVSSPGTSSLTARRRNALNADEHYEIIAETTHRRQKKSMSRLFEPSSSSVIDQSDAARSHHLQRTRQVTMRCDHCEHLVIFDAVKCTACGIVWHKKCLAHVSVFCGPSARRLTDSASRRMSIFGVPLKGHLEAQKRRVPLILEKCIDELQHRGMTCKGIYRTCGVKSKIEQICACFEQATTEIDVKLNDVHPMNLASVVKLYLRKLPEPLMSFSLYREWLDFDTDMEHTALVKCLRELALKLPEQNYDTLKCLLLHLKKVTWFEAENLMTASNLAAVISPSLIWHRAAHTGPSTPANAAAISHTSFISDAHLQTKVVETLIRNAFEIFSVDEQSEWKAFFECYPDVPEPTVCSTDLAVTNIGVDDTGALCDEDDLEEEYELCDEEPEPTCSSSLVSQQPPTPDLLRNTSNARKLESSSDDMDLDGATSAATFNALVRKYKGNATENNAAAAALPPSPQTAANERNKISKQRSYTTSILVSPQSDRKMILPQKQHSVEESEQDIREGNTRRNTGFTIVRHVRQRHPS